MSEKQQELISIIVPSYNVEKYIDACVESICGQTYEKLEIILVDDGATDRTGEKCDEWADRDDRIKVIHQKNRGLSGARNAGIREAKGEYLAFIDSDDMIAKDYVETLYKCAVDNKVLLAQGRSNNFYKEEDIKGFTDSDGCKVLSSAEMCRILMSEYRKGWGIVMTKLFHRSLFDDLEFPEGRIHEDEYMVYRLFWKAGRIALSDKIVYYYRSKREGSITHSGFSLKRLDVLDARRKRYEFFEELGEKELQGYALLSLCQAQADCLGKLRNCDIDDKDKYIDEIKKELTENFREVKRTPTVSSKKKLSLWLDIYMPWVKRRK